MSKKIAKIWYMYSIFNRELENLIEQNGLKNLWLGFVLIHRMRSIKSSHTQLINSFDYRSFCWHSFCRCRFIHNQFRIRYSVGHMAKSNKQEYFLAFIFIKVKVLLHLLMGIDSKAGIFCIFAINYYCVSQPASRPNETSPLNNTKNSPFLTHSFRNTMNFSQGLPSPPNHLIINSHCAWTGSKYWQNSK